MRIDNIANQFERAFCSAGCSIEKKNRIIDEIKKKNIHEVQFFLTDGIYKYNQLTINVNWEMYLGFLEEGDKSVHIVGEQRGGETANIKFYLDKLIKAAREYQLDIRYSFRTISTLDREKYEGCMELNDAFPNMFIQTPEGPEMEYNEAADDDFKEIAINYKVFTIKSDDIERNREKAKKVNSDNNKDLTLEDTVDNQQYNTNNLDKYLVEAEQGDVNAQNALAGMYYYGHGVAKNAEKAYKWAKKAADQDDAIGQYNLGLLYSQGVGVHQDYTKAYELYKKAADQDYTNAQVTLGNIYYYGQGVAQDVTKAYELYKKAAEKGSAVGLYNLGELYEKGEGVLQDYTKACECYEKAVDQGYALAKEALERVRKAKNINAANGANYPQANEADPAVKAVIAKIDAIGTVRYTEASRKRISAARMAYSNLSVSQRMLVRTDKLNKAESEYEALKNEEENSKKKKRMIRAVCAVLAVCIMGFAVFNIVSIHNKPTALTEKFIASAKRGDEFLLGKYEQDNDLTNGQEAIEWVVLGKDNDTITAMSKYCIEDMPFNDADIDTPTNWSQSTIRKWLNADFYNSAFSNEEKSRIKLSHLSNPGDKNFSIDGGEDTDDYIFLIGEDIIEKYYGDYKSGAAYKAQYTEYAKQKYIKAEPREDYDAVEKQYGIRSCFWWTRITGDHNYSMLEIINSGEFISAPAKANCGIRPVIVIKGESNTTTGIHYYNYDLQQPDGDSYDGSFGPSYWNTISKMSMESQISEAFNEMFSRMRQDPVMAAACLAYIDKEMGTRYTGFFYSEISDNWISNINTIARKYIDDDNLWSKNVQAATELLRSSATCSIEKNEGGKIKSFIMKKGEECPQLVSGYYSLPEGVTYHDLVFVIKVKGKDIKLSFLIESGFPPVLGKE